MDDERLVFVLTKDPAQKCIACLPLIIEYPTLAQAGIHQQTERERKVGFSGEITDWLRVAVFFQQEIIFRKVALDLAVLVANRDRHIHHFHFDRISAAILQAVKIRCKRKQK